MRIVAFRDQRPFNISDVAVNYVKERCQYAGEISPIGGGPAVSIYRFPSPLAGKTWEYGCKVQLAMHLNTAFPGLTRGIKPDHVKAIAWHFGWGPQKERDNLEPNTDTTPNPLLVRAHAVPAGRLS